MKKILHPSFKTVMIWLVIFFVFIDAVLAIGQSAVVQSRLWYYVATGIFIILLLLILLYWIIDLLLRHLKEHGSTAKEQLLGYRNEKRFRRVVNSYVGDFVNFGMAIFYMVYFYARGNTLYFITMQFFLFAFIGRAALLYPEINHQKREKNKSLMIAAIFTLLLAMSIQGLTIYFLLTDHVPTKNPVLMYLMAAYGFTKFVFALISIISSFREKEAMLFSLAMISLCCACYSMLMLIINMPNTFAKEGTKGDRNFISIGLAIATALAVIALVTFFKAKKRRKKDRLSQLTDGL